MDSQWTLPAEPACSRCLHTADLHMHGEPLSCAFCALSPMAHVVGIGCSSYTLRTWPASGARCRMPKCKCEGYRASAVGGQELSGAGGRQ